MRTLRLPAGVIRWMGWVLIALGVVSFSRPAGAQALASAAPESVGMSTVRLERVGQIVRAEIEAGRLPGAVVAIARKGKLVYHQAFGFADRVAGKAMPLDAMFNIASMTKPLTAVGALILYEEGRLLLTDPVGAYLPQLDTMPVAVMAADGLALTRTEPAARKPTLQDLMRHTAGVTYGSRGTSDLHKRYGELRLDVLSGAAFIDRLSALPLHFQPGTRWDYGFGFDVLGLVIEAVTGQTLGRHLQERLFAPAGMVDTGFLVPSAKAERYARPLPMDPLTGTPQRLPDRTQPATMECGGGCGVSTASDYLRFAQMLLDGGSLGGRRILGRKAVELMTTDQLGPEVNADQLRQHPAIHGHGFSLGLAVRRGSGMAGVLGSPGDYTWGGSDGTYFWVDPKEELAAVFMSAAPGPVRWRHQQLITALVLQAITD